MGIGGDAWGISRCGLRLGCGGSLGAGGKRLFAWRGTGVRRGFGGLSGRLSFVGRISRRFCWIVRGGGGLGWIW